MNIKKTSAVILSVTIALGMVSCKEDKEESSKSKSKSNNANVNTESVSESSSTSANEESIADSVESLVDSQEESLDDSESNNKYKYEVKENFSGEWEYEICSTYFYKSFGVQCGYSYQDTAFSVSQPVFFEVAGIHSNKQDIIFNLDDSSEWLSNSYDSFVEMFDKTNQYSLNEAEKPIVFENEEEVEINGVKFIRFDGYFTDEELGKVNLYGYISTYQNDNARRVFKEPDVLGFIVTLPEEEKGQELLEEFATHAVESLKFINK